MSGHRTVLPAAALFLSLVYAAAAGPYRRSVFADVRRFAWKEDIKPGISVRESGPLFTVGARLAKETTGRIGIEAEGGMFFGSVDYDGFLESEESFVPYGGSTSYFGIGLKGRVSVPLCGSERRGMKPFAGLDTRYWRRGLGSGFFFSDHDERGYDEFWLAAYGVLGAESWIELDGERSFRCSVSMLLPVATAEYADLSNVGGPSDIRLEPRAERGFSIEAGLRVRSFIAEIFWETLSFSESDLDGRYRLFLQPKSEARIAGFRVGKQF